MAEKIKLITVCSHPDYAQVLVKSAQLHGWDLAVIHCEWKGFGTKLIETYNYLKANPEVERFVFCDAFDVVVIGTQQEFESKIDPDRVLLSSERGLWPPTLHPFKEMYSEYSQYNGFYYPNSGLYYSKSRDFIKLYEKYPPFYEIDDQYWWNMVFLFQGFDDDGWVKDDNFQKVFNSHSFIADGEYTYENGRVQIMGNEPCFIHSNGKTSDPKLDELVTKMLA